jgi:photosystem II stability/assembly factor-like uncharacterized protein
VERVEELLREEFRRADGTPVVPRDTMLARVARVRRRRMATATGFAAAMVSGAVVAAAAGLGGGGTQSAAGTDHPDYTAQLINVVFTDHDHGYVLQERCGMLVPDGEVPIAGPTPDVHRQCRSQLLVTTDAGAHWQYRVLPADPATKDAGVPTISGHSLALWVDSPGTLALGGFSGRYWTTTDGGRTWHESATPRDLGTPGSLAVFGPDDRVAFLATPPPTAVGEKNPVVPATDGSFWVACESGPYVFVTRDRGQTWQRSVTPPAAAVDWVATTDGHTVYAAVRAGGTPRLVRSTDGGTSWAEFTGITGLPPRGADGLALANGDLIMTEATADGGTYRLKAGTTAVEKLPKAPTHPHQLYRTADWVVAAQAWDERPEPNLASVVSISPDNGTTWRTISAPGA